MIGASSGGQCQKTGGSDNAGLPRSPLGGFRGTVDSVSEKTIVLTTLGADGSTTKTTVEVNDTTLFADRHRVNGDAIVEGKCIIAGGTNDTDGTLQALTINLPLVVDGTCPSPRAADIGVVSASGAVLRKLLAGGRVVDTHRKCPGVDT